MTTRRIFLKTSAAALAAPALPRFAAAQSLSDTSDQGDGPVRCW